MSNGNNHGGGFFNVGMPSLGNGMAGVSEALATTGEITAGLIKDGPTLASSEAAVVNQTSFKKIAPTLGTIGGFLVFGIATFALIRNL